MYARTGTEQERRGTVRAAPFAVVCTMCLGPCVNRMGAVRPEGEKDGLMRKKGVTSHVVLRGVRGQG